MKRAWQREQHKGIYALTPEERMSVVWLTKQDIAEKMHNSVSCLNNWVAIGYFPKPVKFGNRCLWHPHVVDKWMLDQVEKVDE